MGQYLAACVNGPVGVDIPEDSPLYRDRQDEIGQIAATEGRGGGGKNTRSCLTRDLEN